MSLLHVPVGAPNFHIRAVSNPRAPWDLKRPEYASCGA
jgi:hypothetical protein